MSSALNLGFGTLVAVSVLLCVGVCGQNVLKCMSCTKALHFTQCEEMVDCDPEKEVCYVEEEIDVGGETVVNAGCREKTLCDAIGCFGDENKRKKRSTNPLDKDIICHHCCDGDFCNMYGCPDSFDVSHLQGSRCFVCDLVLRPEHCNTIKNCDAGYSCGQERLSFGAGQRYKLLCVRTQKCELLKLMQKNNSGRKKRSYQQLGADCCDSHLCNGYMPMKKDPPSMWSATYKCPVRDTSLRPIVQASQKTNTPITSTTTTTTTTSTTTTARKTTTTEAICEDIDPDCDVYGVDYICKGDYLDWAKQHCAKYCSFCGTTTIQTTQSADVCEDLDSDCWDYGRDYICTGDYVPWSQIHCNKYCGFCGATCVDQDKDCFDYGHDYICTGDYIPWSKLHCKKYCGFCDDVTTSTARPVTAVPKTTSKTVTSKDGCFDQDSNCEVYGTDFICKGYMIRWSERHCAKHCNLCSDTTTKADTHPRCVDLDSDCGEYGNDYICTGDYIPWSRIHCNETCNFCHDRCVDLDSDCASYGSDYICNGDYLPWSEIHCAKYCDLCQTATSPTTTAKATTTLKITTTQTTIPTSTTIKTTTQTTTKPTTTKPSTTTPVITTTLPPPTPTTTKRLTTTPTTTTLPTTSSTTAPKTTTPPTTTPTTTTPPTTTPKTTKPTTTSTTTTLPTTTPTTTKPSTTTPITTKPTAKPTTTKRPTTTPTTTTLPTTTSTTTPKTTTPQPTTLTTTAPPPTTSTTTTLPTTTPTTTAPPTTTPTTTAPPTTTPTTTKPTTTPTTTTQTTTTSTTSSPSEACGNKLADCHKYKLELCTDLDQREWMWDNCRGHCKMCLQNKPCKDDTQGCADFKEMICGDPMMKLECKDTCGIC